MGEWKRVFCDARRMSTVLLTALLSAVFFFAGRAPYFGPDFARVTILCERYFADLAAELRLTDEESIRKALDAEEQMLDNYYWYRTYGKDHESFDMMRSGIEGSRFLSSLERLDDEPALRAVMAAEAEIDELTSQLDHIAGYHDYIDSIGKQAYLQSMTSVFGGADSFARRNIAKTASEFDLLRDVEVEFGSNRAYEGFVTYELADYFYLCVIVIFVFAFLEERNVGICGVVRSCRYGRGRLGVHRILILALASILSVILIYGGGLLLSVSLSGDLDDLGRAVQSLECFRTLTVKRTIGGWIAEYMLVKAACGFAVGMILWCLLGTITNAQYSFAALCAVVFTEYALFSFLPRQSIFNPVKYFNIFSYIRTSVLYTDYLNINLFDHPFGIRDISLGCLPVITIALIALTLIMANVRHPEGHRDLLSRAAGVWDMLTDKWRCSMTAGGWEIYKSLFHQHGAFILAIVIIVGGSLNFESTIVLTDNEKDIWYQAYLRDLAGPLTDAADEYIASARASSLDDPDRTAALDKVEAHINELRRRAEAGAYEPVIVSDAAFRSVYGADAAYTQRMNASILMIFVIAVCASVMPYEERSGMVYVLRSQKRGRGAVFAYKTAAAVIMTFVACASVYIREISAFISHADSGILSSSIRNLDCFADSPFIMTVWQYMLALYAVRCAAVLSLSFVVLYVSSYTKTVGASYAALFVLLGAPALLYALGVDMMGHITPVCIISAAGPMWEFIKNGRASAMTSTAVWVTAGVLMLILCKRRWCSCKRPHIRQFMETINAKSGSQKG